MKVSGEKDIARTWEDMHKLRAENCARAQSGVRRLKGNGTEIKKPGSARLDGGAGRI